jgi:hypothetical protein
MTEVQKIPSSFFMEEELSDYAKGFLEAAIDGEGSIMLMKTKRLDRRTGRAWQPVVKVSNKSHKWLELVAELASGGRVDHICHNWKGELYMGYIYVMPRNVIRRVLPQLGLVIKERQRVLLLEALVILESHKKGIMTYNPERFARDEKRLDEIRAEIKYLNRKNKPVSEDE